MLQHLEGVAAWGGGTNSDIKLASSGAPFSTSSFQMTQSICFVHSGAYTEGAGGCKAELNATPNVFQPVAPKV